MPPEPVAQTFARIPGKDSPSLFTSIVSVHFSKPRNEGTLEIALFNPCGPWIAVPVAPANQFENGVAFDVSRVSLSFSASNKQATAVSTADFVVYGTAARPETFRVVGLNEAVLLAVPFRSLHGLEIKGRQHGEEFHGENLEFIGWYDLGSYSARDKTYRQNTRQYRVPSAHTPVPVIQEK